MKFSMYKELFALLALCAAIWGGLMLLDIGPDETDFDLSTDKEEKLGELMMRQVLIEHPEINTPVLDEAMASIAERLLTPLENSAYKYQILVVDYDLINAFALPGGYIIVCEGLLEHIEKPEELAAIVAHEIGHIENQHVVKRLVKILGIEILTAALTGGDDILLGELMKNAASIAFDRQQEREADQFALDHLLKAKINPRVIAGFFRKIQTLSSELEQKLAILSNHPDIPSRIRAALQYKIPKDAEFVPFPIEWQDVLESVNNRDNPEKKDENPVKDGGPV